MSQWDRRLGGAGAADGGLRGRGGGQGGEVAGRQQGKWGSLGLGLRTPGSPAAWSPQRHSEDARGLAGITGDLQVLDLPWLMEGRGDRSGGGFGAGKGGDSFHTFCLGIGGCRESLCLLCSVASGKLTSFSWVQALGG